jgi:hypothetical protein
MMKSLQGEGLKWQYINHGRNSICLEACADLVPAIPLSLILHPAFTPNKDERLSIVPQSDTSMDQQQHALDALGCVDKSPMLWLVSGALLQWDGQTVIWCFNHSHGNPH